MLVLNLNKTYECSSRGDKRFSALYALLPDKHTIEWHYQVRIKGYNSIKEGKGKRGRIYDLATQRWKYIELWRTYLEANPNLFKVLHNLRKQGYIFTDTFARGAAISQAEALMYLTNERKMYYYSPDRATYMETVAYTRQKAANNIRHQLMLKNVYDKVSYTKIKEEGEIKR